MKRDLQSIISSSPLMLTEGSVIERLRREYRYELHPHILNANCIYDPKGKNILEEIYLQYISIGKKKNIPLILFTPTWRANPERLGKSGLMLKDVNGENFRFIDSLRSKQGAYAEKILIGGLTGCKGDAYKPEEALSVDDAFHFHQTQTRALANAGVDFLFATTLPAFTEAFGIAKAMALTAVPYIISFVVYAEGTLLDGTPLKSAIEQIDKQVTPKPFGYFINCVHPTVFEQAINNSKNSSAFVRGRILGLQANTSSKRPEELDGSVELISEEPEQFASSMVLLNKKYGIKILGGCCGTNDKHIESIMEILLK
ncbi:MAG: homocysteine S-methyltransferase family protein [Ignavibacteriales bacterium]|nr:homocysteine S-methyltransferase family protein [Ignavibacteriales bacterium]